MAEKSGILVSDEIIFAMTLYVKLDKDVCQINAGFFPSGS